jgi:hypothetical protein
VSAAGQASLDTIPGAVSLAAERLRQRVRAARYLTDPVLWAKDKLGITLWSKQRTISESLVHNKRTAVKSCHGVGKTYLAAILTCWWIDIHDDEEVTVVTTAPTQHQVNVLLWGYIRQLHRLGKLRGTVNEAAQWKSGDRDYIAYGRKPADTNLSAFQGTHRRYLLAIIDEAGGVGQAIWDGVDAITTVDTNRVLAIGNPDDPNTKFGRIWRRNDANWSKIGISAFDTPNFTNEGKKLPPEMLKDLVSKKWVEQCRLDWGTDDRRWISKVLGDFPKESFDTLFTDEVIAKSRDSELIPGDESTVTLGVDVARFGSDLTTVAMNYGGVITIAASWSKQDTVETAKGVHDLAERLGADEVRVDGVGIGAGVVDQLVRRDDRRYRVIEINGGASSPDPRRWYNYRAYLYDFLRARCARGEVRLPVPDGDESDEYKLGDELTGVRYKFLGGAMLLESKDDIRRRGGKSPDFADAVTYAVSPFDATAELADKAVGDIVTVDAQEAIEDELISGQWVIAPY